MSARTRLLPRIGRALAVTACGLALAAGGGEPAHADNTLRSSEPSDGAVLSSSPTELRLEFAEAVGPASTVSVSCNTNPASIGLPEIDNDTTLLVAIAEPLPKGACSVSWGVTDAADEPNGTGSFTFSIEQDTADTTTTASSVANTTTPPTTAATDPDAAAADSTTSARGPLWLGRVLSALGMMIVFGAIVLIVMAWPEGPEYVLTVRFLKSVWVLALAGTTLFVISLTAHTNESSLGKALNPSTWLDLLDAGWSGRAALARLVLVVVSGWVVFRPERVIDPTTQMAAVGLPMLAVATMGLSRTGGDFAALGVAMGIVHALSTAIWFGGAALLARVVLAGPGEEDLVHAVRGFGRISMPAVFVAVGSGLVQLFRLDGGTLFSEPHGQVLVLKVVIVAAMLYVALTARQFVSARMGRAAELTVPAAERLRRAFTTEAALGVCVLLLSGWLLALRPGNIEPSDGRRYAVVEPIVDPASDLDITVSINPARVGLNGLRVEVDRPETGLTGLTVTFTPPIDSGAPAIQQPVPQLSGKGTAVLDQSVGLPFNAPGVWSLSVSATTPTGSVTEARTTFEVQPAEGTPTSDTATTTGASTSSSTTPTSG